MKIYIAGPMTGVPDWNIPAFFAAAEAIEAAGHTPFNPAASTGATPDEAISGARVDQATGSAGWSDYLRRDLRMLTEADAVCTLPGWQSSRGANVEFDTAATLGIPALCLTEGTFGNLIPRVRAIGLSGYARSGKDTVADMLAEHGWQRVAFADKLKEAVARLNPEVGEHRKLADMTGAHRHLQDVLGGFDDWRTAWEYAKDRYPEVRRLLQVMGTEVGREMFGETFWVDLAVRSVPDGARAVFTDCRFPSEARAVAALGGELWRISREGTGPLNGHSSETALDEWPFDRVIRNDGSLDDLRSAVELARSQMAGGWQVAAA